MTKQEFGKGIGRKVSEKTFEVANAVYMSDKNEYMSKDSFYTLWKDQDEREQLLMDYAADIAEQNRELKKENGELNREVVALGEQNEELKEENNQLKEDVTQLKEARDAEARKLIEASRGLCLPGENEEDALYKAAVRLVGRRATVTYCLEENYMLSAEDEKWLLKELTKNK